MRLMICTAHPISFGDQIEKGEGVGHVACMGDSRGVYRILVGKPEGKRSLRRSRRLWEDTRWIFRKWDVGVQTGSSWLRIGTGGGHLSMR